MSQNSERILTQLLRKIARRHNIRVTSFCHDWIFALEHQGNTTYVFGYDFGLNNATAMLIAKDKAATSETLQHIGIPHVEHCLFVGPQLAAFVPVEGNWEAILKYFEQHDCDVVCKPAQGTGGADVFRVRSSSELERAVHRIFQKHNALCMSPFYRVQTEYRAIVLDDMCEVVFAKQPIRGIGDGLATTADLMIRQLSENSRSAFSQRALREGFGMDLDLESVPRQGEQLPLFWKHNLGQGAEATLVASDDPARAAIEARALAAAAAIGMRFCSVDLIAVGVDLLVLEINSGVMMESFARVVASGLETAERIYERAICLSLRLPA